MGISTEDSHETGSFRSTSDSTKAKTQTCNELATAVDSGKVGDIVAKHEKLILQYYEDVQRQATDSFKAAKFVASLGFAVLIITWLYTLGFDLAKLKFTADVAQHGINSPAYFGTISAGLIEFIAGVNFWLYSKASKQFGAFHICLERTHRYLVAYKIGEETGTRRERVLENLACIMASAPMISHQDIESLYSRASEAKQANPAFWKAEVGEKTIPSTT